MNQLEVTILDFPPSRDLYAKVSKSERTARLWAIVSAGITLMGLTNVPNFFWADTSVGWMIVFGASSVFACATNGWMAGVYFRRARHYQAARRNLEQLAGARTYTAVEHFCEQADAALLAANR